MPVYDRLASVGMRTAGVLCTAVTPVSAAVERVRETVQSHEMQQLVLLGQKGAAVGYEATAVLGQATANTVVAAYHTSIAAVRLEIDLVYCIAHTIRKGIAVPIVQVGRLALGEGRRVAEAVGVLMHLPVGLVWKPSDSLIAARNDLRGSVSRVLQVFDEAHALTVLLNEKIERVSSPDYRFAKLVSYNVINALNEISKNLAMFFSKVEHILAASILNSGDILVKGIGNGILALIDLLKSILNTVYLSTRNTLKLLLDSSNASEIYLRNFQSNFLFARSLLLDSIKRQASIPVLLVSKEFSLGVFGNVSMHSKAISSTHSASEVTESMKAEKVALPVHEFLKQSMLSMAPQEVDLLLSSSSLNSLKSVFQQDKVTHSLEFLTSSKFWGKDMPRKLFAENLNRIIGCSLENRILPRVLFMYTKKVEPLTLSLERVLSSTDKKFVDLMNTSLEEYNAFKKSISYLNLESLNDFNFDSVIRKLSSEKK